MVKRDGIQTPWVFEKNDAGVARAVELLLTPMGGSVAFTKPPKRKGGAVTKARAKKASKAKAKADASAASASN
eukprot:6717664-Alexandrium_andersonii.AAC.1